MADEVGDLAVGFGRDSCPVEFEVVADAFGAGVGDGHVEPVGGVDGVGAGVGDGGEAAAEGALFEEGDEGEEAVVLDAEEEDAFAQAAGHGEDIGVGGGVLGGEGVEFEERFHGEGSILASELEAGGAGAGRV